MKESVTGNTGSAVKPAGTIRSGQPVTLARMATVPLPTGGGVTLASLMGSGGRAEKIRTYRWKEAIAVDHRIDASFPLQKLMSGEMDELLDALHRMDVAERLARLE